MFELRARPGRHYLENLATIVLILAATAVALANVKRAFIRPSLNQLPTDQAAAATFIENWKDLLADGVLIGDSAAAVKIIDFSDLQCPFCRRFHSAIADARTKHGSQVARVFVHCPLSNHQLAMPAAVAAECAAASGRFAAFIDLTYEKQDSLGVKSWTSLAAAAGVQDTAAFAKCVANTKSFPRIERGLRLGSALGVRGTPTVIVNGWRLARPPYNELPTLIETILSGKAPFPK